MDTRWSSTTKLLILICLLLFAAWLTFRFADIIPPLLVAVIVAYLLKPPTDWLVRRTGWPRGLAVIVLFLILLSLIILAPVLITPSVAGILRNIKLDLSALDPIWQRLSGANLQIGPFTLSGGELAPDLNQAVQNMVAPFATGALQLVSGVALSLFYLVFVIVVIFWLLKDSYKLEGWFIDHISPSYQGEVVHLLREIGEIWGNFFRGELALAVVVGSLVALSMWMLGLPNIFLLAFFAALGEFVPTIGPVLAAIPAILIALVNGSSWLHLHPLLLGLIVALVYMLIFQFEQIYLLPRIVGRRVRLHPGVVFVGTIIGATQIGLLGVLIAAPVIATMRLFGGYIYSKMLDREPFAQPAGAEPGGIAWRGMIRGQPVAGILFDLDGTLIDTDDHLIEQTAARLGPLRRLFPDRDPRPAVRHLLLAAEGPINWLITQLDRLHLDDNLFRLHEWLRQVRGYRRTNEMQVIPGVLESVHILHSGYKLALVTTRPRAAAEHFLALTGLQAYFAVVVTADDVQRLKPHPEPLLRAMTQLGLPPEQCVMVGDTTADLLAAQAAGIRAVAVLCGFGRRRELEEADLLLDSTAELTHWL